MKRLAITRDGDMTYCTSEPGLVGTGRCKHVDHQKEGESNADFVSRIKEEKGLG